MKPETDIEVTTYYTTEGLRTGSCGHRHHDIASALACIRHRGCVDRAILQVRTRAPGVSESRPSVDFDAVVIGDPTIDASAILAPYSVVRGDTQIGRKTRIDSFAVIGGDPQQVGFDPETRSGVTIGDSVTIREGVTVHRSIEDGGRTTVGDESYLMTNSHVGHDSTVGRFVVLSSNAMLAGHVEIGDHAVVGGGAGLHQFVRIGSGAMIGGNASITRDVPPFTMAAERDRLSGLNVKGLRRRDVDEDSITDLRACYRCVFGEAGDIRESAQAALAGDACGHTALGREFLEFFEGGTRGFVRPRVRGRGSSC